MLIKCSYLISSDLTNKQKCTVKACVMCLTGWFIQHSWLELAVSVLYLCVICTLIYTKTEILWSFYCPLNTFRSITYSSVCLSFSSRGCWTGNWLTYQRWAAPGTRCLSSSPAPFWVSDGKVRKTCQVRIINKHYYNVFFNSMVL